jgi:hypothetical protein
MGIPTGDLPPLITRRPRTAPIGDEYAGNDARPGRATSSARGSILVYCVRMMSMHRRPWLAYFRPGTMHVAPISETIRTVQIGSPITIHLRAKDGRLGKAVGAGKVIHPQAVQVLPPFDEQLSTVGRRADEFLITADGIDHPVSRIRPGLVSYPEAAKILAREIPQVELTPTKTGLVVLETDQDICPDPLGICSSPWWCKVLCLKSCSSC